MFLPPCRVTIRLEELIQLQQRMTDERKELAAMAGIKSKAQRKNMCKRINSRGKGYYDSLSPAMKKWHNQGKSIKRIVDEIIELKKTLAAGQASQPTNGEMR